MRGLPDAPEITTQINIYGGGNSKSYELEENKALFMTITASGDKPLNYTWQRDGVSVKSSETAYFSEPKAQVSDSGVYRCIVGNSLGSVRSLPFSVSVKG